MKVSCVGVGQTSVSPTGAPQGSGRHISIAGTLSVGTTDSIAGSFCLQPQPEGCLAPTGDTCTVSVLPGAPVQTPDHPPPGALAALPDQHLRRPLQPAPLSPRPAGAPHVEQTSAAVAPRESRLPSTRYFFLSGSSPLLGSKGFIST